jgi:hypothetical protein
VSDSLSTREESVFPRSVENCRDFCRESLLRRAWRGLYSACLIPARASKLFNQAQEQAENEARVQALIPLKPRWFHIMLSLAGEEQHGYGIMQEVLQRTTGKVRLWPATLYGSIKRMIEADLFEGSDRRPLPGMDDARPENCSPILDERFKRSFGMAHRTTPSLRA